MWGEFFSYTLRSQIRRPSFALLAFISFTAGCCFASYPTAYFVAPSAVVNSPLNIASILSTISIILSVLAVGLVAGPVWRDRNLSFDTLIFSRAVSPASYVTGRLLAGNAVLLLLIGFAALGVLLAGWMPWVKPESVGAISVTALAWTFIFLVVPNCAFVCSLFFFLIVVTRSMRATYLGVILLWALWVLSGLFGTRQLAQLLDPFGSRALFRTVINRLIPDQLATAQPWLTDVLVANRIIWLLVTAVLIGITLALFRLVYLSRNSSPPPKGQQTLLPTLTSASCVEDNIPQSFRQWIAIVKSDLANSAQGILFVGALGIGLFLFWSELVQPENPYFVPSLPIFHRLLETQGNTYQIVLMLVIGFYAGELVHRDVDAKFNGITNALPVPPFIWISAKIAVLLALALVWQAIGAVFAVSYGALYGINLPLLPYALGALATTSPAFLLAIAAVCMQYAVGRKFVGFLLTAGLLLSQAIPSIGPVDSNLYRFAFLPLLRHSDIVGFGTPLNGWFSYALYWSLCIALIATLLLVVLPVSDHSVLGFHKRNNGSFWKCTALTLAIAWIGVGAWIFYNTDIRNAPPDAPSTLANLATYERLYRHLLSVPQPGIESVEAAIEYLPSERRVHARGHLTLRNDAGVSIEAVYLDIPSGTTMRFPLLPVHRRLRWLRPDFLEIDLEQPLATGSAITIGFDSVVAENGFQRGAPPNLFDSHAAFVSSEVLLPCIGYNKAKELDDHNVRRRYALKTKPATVSATVNNQATYLGCGRGLARLDVVLSARHGLQAITSGDLVSKNQDNDRAVFHYRTSTPTLALWGFVWGDWFRESTMVGDVKIDLLSYEGSHNIGHILKTAQRAIATYSSAFSPYKGKRYTLVEVSRFVPGPRSFPGMSIIPESSGFYADFGGNGGSFSPVAGSFDQVAWTIAHEISHQWWGLRVVPSDKPGEQFITESLAQYSALRLIQSDREVSPNAAISLEQRNYFTARSRNNDPESPLSEVTDQPFVAYSKGLIVLNSIGQILQEKTLDSLLSDWILSTEATPGRVSSASLVDILVSYVKPQERPYVKGLLEQVTTFDVSVQRADVIRTAEGAWRSSAVVFVKQEGGTERLIGSLPLTARVTLIDPDQPGAIPRPLATRHFDVALGKNTIFFITRQRPDKIEIDSGELILDPSRENNSRVLLSALQSPPRKPNHPVSPRTTVYELKH